MKDIMTLAREAGLRAAVLLDYFGTKAALSNSERDELYQIEYFAVLVRNQALEEAATVCERAVETIWEYHSGEVKATGRNVCTNLATSIRSLKEGV